MLEDQIKTIFTQLEEHEKRIRAIEDGVAPSTKKKSVDNGGRGTKSKGEDLHAPIQRLVQDNFFKEAKTDLDVVSELQRRLLTRKKPLRASTVNVMRAMVRGGVLERTEIVKSKRTLIAYKKS